MWQRVPPVLEQRRGTYVSWIARMSDLMITYRSGLSGTTVCATGGMKPPIPPLPSSDPDQSNEQALSTLVSRQETQPGMGYLRHDDNDQYSIL